MKVNLLLNNPKGVLNGYVNIDPFADGKDCRVSSNVTNLEIDPQHPTVCNGEAEEIVADDIIDYFPVKDVVPILKCWTQKLAYGGVLIIGTVDLEEVMRGLRFGNIDIVAANRLLYGRQTKDWEYKKCCLSLHDLIELLKENGLSILKTVNENFRCVVVAQRPEFLAEMKVAA